MNKLTRRSFVQGTAATAGALGLGLVSGNRVRGANDSVRIGVVGTRGRGQTHIDWAKNVKGTRLVALCDCDQEVLNKSADKVEKDYPEKPIRETDFRRLLDRKDIDVISIATPNHTHSLIAIWAIQAGKDVYVEKPVSHNVWEGRQIVNYARKYNKIVQTGTQSRSNPGTQELRQFLQSGQLGKIQYAVATCYKSRSSIGKLDKPLNIPAHIDYDLWCGPRPKADLYRPHLHYDWHWDYNTGNGDLGNQGIHQMDLARWFLGYDQLSPRIMSLGGRVGYEDAGNTPNTQIAFHDYPGAPIIFEVRGLPKSKEKLLGGKWGNSDVDMERFNNAKVTERQGAIIGVVVFCEGGFVVNGSYESGKAYSHDGKVIKSFYGGGDHYENFVKALRSRDYKDLNADIEQGHLSSALCHTANLSYQLGKQMSSEEIKAQIKGNATANESFERFTQHLAKLDIPVDGNPRIQTGPWLEMDPRTERFTNNEQANAMLKGSYRAPFTIEEIQVAGR